MERVYIPKEPYIRDPNSDALLPKFDLQPALQFGNPVIIYEKEARLPLSAHVIMLHLRKMLADFDDDDYLLPVGPAPLIAMASVVAAEANEGRVALLQWNHVARKYVVMKTDGRPK